MYDQYDLLQADQLAPANASDSDKQQFRNEKSIQSLSLSIFVRDVNYAD
jgi:hypothetical protein